MCILCSKGLSSIFNKNKISIIFTNSMTCIVYTILKIFYSFVKSILRTIALA